MNTRTQPFPHANKYRVAAIAATAGALFACALAPATAQTFQLNPAINPGSLPRLSPANPTSQNIRKVISAFTTSVKSVSMLVELPPGLNLTAPVLVSLYIEGTWIDQIYVNSSGNHWYYNFTDKDAQARSETVLVGLHEIAPGGQSYSLRWQILVVPLYDIAISPLKFKLLTDGDSVGASDCELHWWTPEGDRETHEVGLHAGESHTFGSFAREYSEVSAADGLLLPEMGWRERDYSPFGYHPVRVASPGPILPGELGTTSIRRVIQEDGGQATGRFSFTSTISLRTYHPSEL